MKCSRRNFVKLAGIAATGSAAALGLPGAARLACAAAELNRGPNAAGAEYQSSAVGLKAKRWGMVIFTSLFSSAEDFMRVVEACHKPHNVPNIEGPQEVKWIWPDTYSRAFPDALPPAVLPPATLPPDAWPAGTLPSATLPGAAQQRLVAQEIMNRRFLLTCNHCENPACVKVCPTGATFKREDGIVAMDYHRCMGCRYCMVACPYGARSFNFSDPAEHLDYVNPRFPRRMMGVVEKCGFCSERLSEGKLPYCVEAANGAIIFGDLADPDSEVSQVLKNNYSITRKPALGTGPSVYYIL